MRLWSLHPSLLDRQGLLAAWREGLLAQSVIVRLQDSEKPGYRNHPQMARFLACDDPLLAIGTWLGGIYKQARIREYNYNYSLIKKSGDYVLTVTDGQLEYEFKHLQAKLKNRDNGLYWFNYGFTQAGTDITPHPLFEVVSGEVENWEKVK